MPMTEDLPNFDGEAPGTAWRAAAWVAFAVAGLLAWLVLRTPSDDVVQVFALVGGTLLVLVVGALGLVFGMFGAAASSTVGDRRPLVMLPVWANAALLLLFVATV